MENKLLYEGIETVCNKIKEIVAKAEPLVNKSAQDFVENHVKMLGGLIGSYAHFFTSVCVSCRNEAVELMHGALVRDRQLEDKVEKFMEHEEMFDLFLESIDKKLSEEYNIDESSKETGKEGDVIAPLFVTDPNNKEDKMCDVSSYRPDGGSLILVMLRHFS